MCLLGWASGSTYSFGYHTAQCSFGCGPVNLEWPSIWAGLFASGSPVKVLQVWIDEKNLGNSMHGLGGVIV